jgi:hypothetical protein
MCYNYKLSFNDIGGKTVMPDKEQKEKSFLEKVHEINEKERLQELEEEASRAKLKAENEQRERDTYAKKLEQERIALMKAKQGIISQEEAFQLEPAVQKKYTVREKISNFFYHYKIAVIIGVLTAVLAIFLIHDFVSKVNPDITVMIIKQDDFLMNNTDAVAAVLEKYCSDYNNDGKIKVDVMYSPSYTEASNSAELYYNQAYQTRLVAEFQSDTVIMFIGDEDTCKYLGIEDGSVTADLSELYPGDENAGKLGYMLSGTNFAEQIGYEEMPDTYFMGFRYPYDSPTISKKRFERNYNNAIETWNKYLAENKADTDK